MLSPARIEGNELAFLREHRSAVMDLGFGTLFVSSESKAISWNFLGRFQAEEPDFERAVSVTEAVCRDWKLRPCIKVTPSTRPGDLGARLDQRGWRAGLSLTHMIDRSVKTRRTRGVAVRVCRTEEDITMFSDVQSRAFDAPEWVTWVHKINVINARRPNQRFYLATRDSRPAGVCLLFNTKGIGGLYAVATLAEERGHGVAAALVARAVTDSARLGNRMTVLNTKSDGAARRAFSRLGFEAVFDSLFFTSQT